MEIAAEICCGGYEDALQADMGGARRVELNSALYLGGLTPGLGTLKLTKETTSLTVISMVRPRGGGFCYSEAEYAAMLRDAEELLRAGTDGIAFGFLRQDRTLDESRTAEMTELIHRFGKTAVFHRAFDCTGASDETMECLIRLGVDRVLTSGGEETALDGSGRIHHLVEEFGDRIQILAGSGVTPENAVRLIRETGVRQIHSSCREWRTDRTAQGEKVSYGYLEGDGACLYDAVSLEKTRELVEAVAGM